MKSKSSRTLSYPPPSMEEQREEPNYFPSPQPPDVLSKLISIQADFIYDCILLFLSPLLSLFSMATQSYQRAEEAKENFESAIQKVTSNITYGTDATLLLKKIRLGFVRVAYLCMVLVVILMLAVVAGLSLVNIWVEEPMCARERLYFDYTDTCPRAISTFDGGGGVGGHLFKKQAGLPVGHTIYVWLVLLMPESDYNRDIGVFQLTAELLSMDGDVIAKSSQPCMLRFESFPVRITRTIVMGVPLVLGMTGETQKIMLQILQHKQRSNPRSRGVRVTLCPRAGTSSLPQLYEAEIIFKSHLPWEKELILNWKWTLYVWMSFYMYILMLTILLCSCKGVLFPELAIPSSERDNFINREGGQCQIRGSGELLMSREKQRGEDVDRSWAGRDESDEVIQLLRKWRGSRRNRKPMSLSGRERQKETETDAVGAPISSSSTVTRKETTTASSKEEVGDSESAA